MPRYPKKLIEVALPLDDINAAASREKSIRHGHPSTLHLWWARRPLAAARAVLFAQLVNDPGGHRGWGSVRGQTKEQAKVERERLFGIIRELVQWENTTNEEVLERARIEIRKSWAETCAITGEDPLRMPPVLDPFAGGGTIPLEAQRLGMDARASDLNPIPVLINKALIEIPSSFSGSIPVGPKENTDSTVELTWPRSTGLAEDIRRYSKWLRNEAWKRVGNLYPQVALPTEYGGGKATVIAWLWARTVKSPNPAYQHCDVPLVSSFVLSDKAKKKVWVDPIISGESYRFHIHSEGVPPKSAENGTKIGRGGNFRCLLSDSAIDSAHIKEQGCSGKMGQRLLAAVVEVNRKRVYLSPTKEMESLAHVSEPKIGLDIKLNHDPRNIWCVNYGLETYASLFTPRQLTTLACFSDLIADVRKQVVLDATEMRLFKSGHHRLDEPKLASQYGDAIATYLAFALDKAIDRNTSLCSWENRMDRMRNTFGRQALPMVWDFAETNPFAGAAGDIYGTAVSLCEAIENLGSVTSDLNVGVRVQQRDATLAIEGRPIISTDPPYYDNIGYADLSDFFYVWLRRSLKDVYPDLFSTMLTPKAEELIAAPYRHGGKENAHQFFMDGMKQALHRMATDAHPAHPVTIYYAFKQSDTKDIGTASSGWEAFLQAVINSGFMVTGTWPMRTELSNRMISMGTNALASSIVLACRPRGADAPTITRRQFIKELGDQLPLDLEDMINGSIGISPVAPVDLAQAAIGPGMAQFSLYASVIEADGSPMTVHQALLLINKAIDDYFDAAEGRMDSLTRFCTRWLSSHGFAAGPYGEADGLSRACGVMVANHAESVESGKGKTRLCIASEHDREVLPDINDNPSIWTSLHRLAGRLEAGDTAKAGAYLARIPQHAADIRALAYRLYTICERSKLTDAARTYNNVITSWDAIVHGSEQTGVVGRQRSLFDAPDNGDEDGG